MVLYQGINVFKYLSSTKDLADWLPNAKTADQFWEGCYSFLEFKKAKEIPTKEILSELYVTLRKLDLIQLYYYDFVKEFYGNKICCTLLSHDPYFKAFYRKRRQRWSRRARTTKYVRNVEHAKKFKGEQHQVKKDWWDRKGLLKDKSKKRSYHRPTNPGRYFKQITSGYRRAAVKNNLKKERWDNIAVREPSWMIIDPWSWD